MDAAASVKESVGYGLIPIALLVCGLVALYVFNRQPDLVVEDSPDFKSALEIWHTLVVARDNTPRGMKRFVNRVRYLAMRQQVQLPSAPQAQRLAQRFGWGQPETQKQTEQAADPIPESVLVALTAMHTCDPTWLQDGSVFVRPLAPRGERHASLLQDVVARHEKEFHNWDKVGNHRRRFLEVASGVRVH